MKKKFVLTFLSLPHTTNSEIGYLYGRKFWFEKYPYWLYCSRLRWFTIKIWFGVFFLHIFFANWIYYSKMNLVNFVLFKLMFGSETTNCLYESIFPRLIEDVPDSGWRDRIFQVLIFWTTRIDSNRRTFEYTRCKVNINCYIAIAVTFIFIDLKTKYKSFLLKRMQQKEIRACFNSLKDVLDSFRTPMKPKKLQLSC